MADMLTVIRNLAPLRRVIAAPDYDRAVTYLQDLLPFEVLEYRRERPRNGWVVPPRWEVLEATISRDGKLVYDGLAHPLGVIALSDSFTGRITREELLRHLHFHHDDPDALPFHYRQQFRSWDRDWGFCVPRRLRDSLPPGEYDVVLSTQESPGALSVLVHDHPGELPITFVLGANLDRPGVANDGIAACAVGVEVMRRLRGRRTRFAWRLVLLPGIIGSEYYLGELPPGDRSAMLAGVFLEMLGTPTPLGLQRSRGGDSALDHVLERTLSDMGAVHRTAAFQEIIINDEPIWEAYGIPMTSLSRCPYPEYHSSRDDAGAMSRAALTEAVDVISAAIERIEATRLVTKLFEGTICLSNPEYDLYVDPGEPVFGNRPGEDAMKLRRLMDLIPALRRPSLTMELAQRVDLEEQQVVDYLRLWEDKGLVRLD